MKKTIALTLIATFYLFACQQSKESSTEGSESVVSYEAISLLGDTLMASVPGEAVLERLAEKQKAYDENPDVENLIWLGRFIAYTGTYNNAIDFYSKGIEEYPEEARLYRHRGHRNISIREFDKAIADFTKAAELREGLENEVEPDGMPNAQNIPVSTLHGNIYYHLGLAHYLKGENEAALAAYEKSLAASRMDDNIVSNSHWLYMINRRLGNEEAAVAVLEAISKDMEIIENFAYHNLCLFYKGEITEAELLDAADGALSANDAINYGLGNWYLANGDTERAQEIFEEIVSHDGWASFGYIAAEADLANAL